MRGIIMVVMALDHTRDFFGIPGQNPTDLATATPALFLTRWITHFCAPVFFLLTGTGARLALQRTAPRAVSRFLLTRGLALIVLELTVVRCFAYQFNVDYKVTFLLVLWALGWSMIALAAMVRAPLRVTAGVGAFMIVAHHALDLVRSANPIWAILHGPGFVLNTPQHVVFAAYPLIPWIGVTFVGFALGGLYLRDGTARRTALMRWGVSLSLAFVALRLLNVYGDPQPWSSQSSPLLTLGSFLNVNKYPPSLAFLLMTLGPALLLLRAMDTRTPALLRPALVIGRVPLFYYVVHFALIHAIAVLVSLVHNGSAHWLFESPDLSKYPFTPPPIWGFQLPWVYAMWAFVVIVMYPLCRWYGGIKRRYPDGVLRYL